MCEFQNLIGVLIGGVLALAGGIGVKIYEHRQQRLSLMSALAGELRAILAVVDDRQVLQTLQNVIEQIRVQQKSLFFPMSVGEMHNLVFRQNADKLGFLRAPLPERIVGLHYRINSIALGFRMLFEASEGRAGWWGEQLRADWHRCLEQHEHILALANEARGLAADVINELEGA
jgi:hypothetical protein